MKSTLNIAVMMLALTAGTSTGLAQSNVCSENFNGPLTGWTAVGAQISVVNQQFVVAGNWGTAQTNAPTANHAAGYHPIPVSGPLPDNQTLELRADLVGTSQDDTWAGLHFFWLPEGAGYILFKDPDEISVWKFYNGAKSNACFFYENRTLKNQNVTLVLALTRRGSDVQITTRVLDKDNANAVLFERNVTDTPQADPTLANGAARGMRSEPDLPGTPWPVAQSPGNVTLSSTWVNAEHAPLNPAAVTFDNLEVWQYESPQLAIQNSVVLSWPLTQSRFVVESAADVNGPWMEVVNPWTRTNNAHCEVSILAPDNLKFFRLQPAP
jgi:hypothetical protein